MAIEVIILTSLVFILGIGFFSYVSIARRQQEFYRPTCDELAHRSDMDSILPENMKYLHKNKNGVYCSSVTR